MEQTYSKLDQDSCYREPSSGSRETSISGDLAGANTGTFDNQYLGEIRFGGVLATGNALTGGGTGARPSGKGVFFYYSGDVFIGTFAESHDGNEPNAFKGSGCFIKQNGERIEGKFDYTSENGIGSYRVKAHFVKHQFGYKSRGELYRGLWGLNLQDGSGWR